MCIDQFQGVVDEYSCMFWSCNEDALICFVQRLREIIKSFRDDVAQALDLVISMSVTDIFSSAPPLCKNLPAPPPPPSLSSFLNPLTPRPLTGWSESSQSPP
jgi:hypothetical protein